MPAPPRRSRLNRVVVRTFSRLVIASSNCSFSAVVRIVAVALAVRLALGVLLVGGLPAARRDRLAGTSRARRFLRHLGLVFLGGPRLDVDDQGEGVVVHLGRLGAVVALA